MPMKALIRRLPEFRSVTALFWWKAAVLFSLTLTASHFVSVSNSLVSQFENQRFSGNLNIGKFAIDFVCFLGLLLSAFSCAVALEAPWNWRRSVQLSVAANLWIR